MIIFANIQSLPGIFYMIFHDAFAPKAAVGGFAGSTIALALRRGVARGAYSNEAGMGTSPIAHAAAATDHPARQGLWGMFDVFFDTMVICTITSLLILTSGVWTATGVEASGMASQAFHDFYGPIGGYIVSFSIFLFAVSTV